MCNFEFTDTRKQNYKTKENTVQPIDCNNSMDGVHRGDQNHNKFHVM